MIPTERAIGTSHAYRGFAGKQCSRAFGVHIFVEATVCSKARHHFRILFLAVVAPLLHLCNTKSQFIKSSMLLLYFEACIPIFMPLVVLLFCPSGLQT